MKLGTQVGLGHGHTALDGAQLPSPKRGHSPQFSAHVYCGQRLDGSRCHLVWRWASFQATLRYMETQLPLPKKGTQPPILGPFLLWPNGWMDQNATLCGR